MRAAAQPVLTRREMLLAREDPGEVVDPIPLEAAVLDATDDPMRMMVDAHLATYVEDDEPDPDWDSAPDVDEVAPTDYELVAFGQDLDDEDRLEIARRKDAAAEERRLSAAVETDPEKEPGQEEEEPEPDSSVEAPSEQSPGG